MLCRRGIFTVGVSFLLISLAAGNAHATVYTGSLSYADGGLTATEEWASAATVLSWTVTDEQPDPNLPPLFLWKYEYTLTVPKKGISHFIVEASCGEDPFTEANLAAVVGASAVEVQEYQPTGASGSNPQMPTHLYGIKFEGWDDEKISVTVSFYSNRIPVWGDFYAKDGKGKSGGPVLLYNAGFADPDPETPVSDGSALGHLIVPDSRTIPEPSLTILLGVGGLIFLRKVRRG